MKKRIENGKLVLKDLLNCVQNCQNRFGGKSELATEDDIRYVCIPSGYIQYQHCKTLNNSIFYNVSCSICIDLNREQAITQKEPIGDLVAENSPPNKYSEQTVMLTLSVIMSLIGLFIPLYYIIYFDRHFRSYWGL